MRGKKGQLALVSILVMLIIFFFIMRANMYGVDWMLYRGQEEAEVLDSFYAPEQAKVFLGNSLRDAGYSILREKIDEEYKNGNTKSSLDICKSLLQPADCSTLAADIGALTDDIELNFADASDIYALDGMDLSIPNYKITATCSGDQIVLAAIPLDEECVDITPAPSEPCEDVHGFDDASVRCSSIKDAGGNYACEWSTDTSGTCIDSGMDTVAVDPDNEADECPLVTPPKEWNDDCLGKKNNYVCCAYYPSMCAWQGCKDITSYPVNTNMVARGGPENQPVDCENIGNEAKCNSIKDSKNNAINACEWQKLYPAGILVTSQPSMLYAYSTSSDGYVTQTISCDEFANMYDVMSAINMLQGLPIEITAPADKLPIKLDAAANTITVTTKIKITEAGAIFTTSMDWKDGSAVETKIYETAPVDATHIKVNLNEEQAVTWTHADTTPQLEIKCIDIAGISAVFTYKRDGDNMQLQTKPIA